MTFLWVEHLEERGQKGERWVLKEPETKFLNKHAHANVINSLCTLEIIYISLFSVITSQSHCRKIEDFIWRFYYRSKVWSVTSQAWHFPLRTTATALYRQPKLCPCWEIPQHSWKSCRCDWELCFNTPGASKSPMGASEAQLLKFHMLSPHGGESEVYLLRSHKIFILHFITYRLKSHRILNHCVIFECTDDHIT